MFYIVGVILLGWVTGVLVNYLADVMPIKRKFVAPFCLNCGEPFSIHNYLFHPRMCRICGKSRTIRVWLVECAFVIASILLYMIPPEPLGYWISLILLAYFGLVTVIDIEYRAILHPVSLAGACLTLVLGIWLHGLKATLLGGVVGFCLMLLFYYLGKGLIQLMVRLRQQEMSESEALGFGDVNLGGVIGLLLGWPGIVAGLVLAVFLAGFVGLLYLIYNILLRRYRPALTIPYGPFLAISPLILLFFRQAITR